ncbi:tripartite tricarboxylate transporter TctB family protein [Pannonibacter sp. Pt2-lr]|uniref:Tripartite tricarboxylate transporter TctB family protein n=1 Tax=Pannonibacter anstelovis TaxID=3121537 RepID=A0ABU7ZSU5_9HYPH
MEKRQDIVTGIIFASVGLTAAWMASGYRGASGTYPMVLGLILTLLGGAVAVRAARSGRNQPRNLVDAPVQMAAAMVVAFIYVAAITPLGFYTASFLLMLAMPMVLGFRRWVYAVTVAVVFMALNFLVFSILLQKPLPREAIMSLISIGA